MARAFDDEIAAGVRAGDRLAAIVDDVRIDTGQGLGTGSGLGSRDAGKWRNHDRAGFGLPPGINDRTAAAADHTLVPDPRLRIDGLADAAEEPQPRQVVTRRQLIAELHHRAYRGVRGVENRHAVRQADLPEARAVRICRRAYIHDDRRARGERPVGDIAVAGNPADISRAPEHVVRAQIEHPLHGELCAEQEPGARMLNPLGLACRA